MIEVSIDTASEMAGAALSEGGALLAEVTWRTKRNHSRELMPALDWLLSSRGRTRQEIGAVFVCAGPGSYAGLRVGMSTAKGLAYGLGAPVAAIGRLAADAEPLAFEGGPRVVAVQAAGRAELAFAAYRCKHGSLVEEIAPRLGRRDPLFEVLSAGDLVCGEIDESLAGDLRGAGYVLARPIEARVLAVMRLGYERFARGDVSDTDAVVPLYLREPAIGPQPQR